MQFSVNLRAGVKMRQEFSGTTFVLAEIGKASSIDVSIEVSGMSQEEIRGVKKGLSVRTSSSFTGATFLSAEDTKIEVIVSRNDLEINYLDGSFINANVVNTVQIKNDGNPLYIAENKRAQIVLNNGPFEIDENLAVVMAANWQRTSYRIRNIGTSDIAVGGAGLTWDQRAIILHPGDFYIEVDAARMPIYILSAPSTESVCNIQTVENIGVEVLLPTVAPTAAPTAAPTTGPTVAPTAAPTTGPTVAPTAAPTTGPTVAPTAAPTTGPIVTTIISSQLHQLLEFSVFGSSVTTLNLNSANGSVGGTSIGLVGTPFGSKMNFGDTVAFTAMAWIASKIDTVINFNPWNLTKGLVGDLKGQTLTPGHYYSLGGLDNTGVLTFDGNGEAWKEWVIHIDAALGFGALARVNLINGAIPENIIWVISGALTMGANSSIAGTVLCRSNIVLGAGVFVKGRVVSQMAITADNLTVETGDYLTNQF